MHIFAYVGFDLLNVLSEEAVNPVESVPRGITGTVLVALLLYCLTSFSVNGVGNLSDAITKHNGDATDALADTFSDNGMHWMSVFICFAAFVGLTPVCISSMMG